MGRRLSRLVPGPLAGYISGYSKAAGVIADQIMSSGRDQDTLIYPFVMCWRHYIELQLKTLIALASNYLDEPHVAMRSHRNDQTDLDNAERVLLQLHCMDPSSEHFRYPVRNSGAPTLDGVARIHVRNFHNVMMGVANLLNGADTGIREMTDTKHEIAEYERDLYEG